MSDWRRRERSVKPAALYSTWPQWPEGDSRFGAAGRRAAQGVFACCL